MAQFMPKLSNKVRLVSEEMTQRTWIREHGLSQAGYVKNYGDPGKKHCSGNGGSSIYAAIIGKLNKARGRKGPELKPVDVFEAIMFASPTSMTPLFASPTSMTPDKQ
jgi:hypothetical protein